MAERATHRSWRRARDLGTDAPSGALQVRWRRALSRAVLAIVISLVTVVGTAGPAGAQDVTPPEPPTPAAPSASETDQAVDGPSAPEAPAEVEGFGVSIVADDGGLAQSVVIVLLLTVVSVAPSILLLMTSFTRFTIVLGLTRQAMGVPTVPPNQVLVGLALFLTFFVMAPVLEEINEVALQPLLAEEIDESEALAAGFEPLREFMLAQTDEEDLALLLRVSDTAEAPESPEDLDWTVVVPAFVLSELRTAFMIAFVIFIPFLVIDLVIGSMLMSLGMVMLPPVFISLPVKLLLFVMVDGWALVVGSLVDSVDVAV